MKKLFAILLILASFVIMGLGVLFVSPYYFYQKIITNEYHSEWFDQDLSSPLIFKPLSVIRIEKSDPNFNEDAWKRFHFSDIQVNLPIIDPFYLIAPILEKPKSSMKGPVSLGLSFLTTADKKLARLYMVEDFYFPDVFKKQQLFTLPIVKQHLKTYSRKEVWKDVFSKNIAGWNIPLPEMVYNLYLLELRQTLFPAGYSNFGITKNPDIGIIELKSTDKDYRTEYILTNKRNRIYAFLLVTNIHTGQSQVLRSHLISNMKFEPSSPSLQNLLVKEFESLPFEKRIEQEGMLLLFSAWSHGKKNENLIKMMIQHLERGVKNHSQLDPLYRYAKEHYGKTFSATKKVDLILDEEVKLLRQIELETQQMAPESLFKVSPAERQTLKEKLQQAKKENVPEESDEILMD